jgi:hypothetical protein
MHTVLTPAVAILDAEKREWWSDTEKKCQKMEPGEMVQQRWKRKGKRQAMKRCQEKVARMQWALLHHADLMPHSTGAAVWCDESSRGGQDRREEITHQTEGQWKKGSASSVPS